MARSFEEVKTIFAPKFPELLSKGLYRHVAQRILCAGDDRLRSIPEKLLGLQPQASATRTHSSSQRLNLHPIDPLRFRGDSRKGTRLLEDAPSFARLRRVGFPSITPTYPSTPTARAGSSNHKLTAQYITTPR